MPATVHQVKRTVIDTVGCAMGGYLSEPAKIARVLAGSVAGNPAARVLGTAEYSSLDMAAFANGCMIRLPGLQRLLLFAGRRAPQRHDRRRSCRGGCLTGGMAGRF